MLHDANKYATLRQLKFQNRFPQYYLQERIRKLEFELSILTKKNITDRRYIEQKLGILYGQLMKMAAGEIKP